MTPQPKSVVSRYTFFVELPLQNEDGGVLVPELMVAPLSKSPVYEGSLVTALTLDDDQSIVYIADSGLNRLVAVSYAPELLLNNRAGVKRFIYENVGLDKVSALAVNLYGRIFWANSDGGKANGVIISAVADAPSNSSI